MSLRVLLYEEWVVKANGTTAWSYLYTGCVGWWSENRGHNVYILQVFGFMAN